MQGSPWRCARGVARVRWCSAGRGTPKPCSETPPEAGGLWAAAKRAAGTAEGWLRSQAVAGSKQIFLFNLKGKLDRIDEARGMTHLYLQRIREGAERLESDAVLQKTDANRRDRSWRQ